MCDEMTSGQAAYEASSPARVAPEGAELARVADKLAGELIMGGMTADELEGADWDEILVDAGERAYYSTKALEARVLQELRDNDAQQDELDGEDPGCDDTVLRCPNCEQPNQFGELCHSCQSDADDAADAEGQAWADEHESAPCNWWGGK